jgi:hypothetical protein
MKFTFKPAPKAFGETPVQKTIDVRIGVDVMEDSPGHCVIGAEVDGKALSAATVAHAVAFAIKQRLANSYVNAATAKNDAGGLLSLSDRLALWSSSLDKVLTKITDPNAAPAWESVFSETRAGESADPVGAEVSRIIRGKLVAWAKKADKKLPKADSDEYKGLWAKGMAKWGAEARATAESIVAARNAAMGDDDFDLDDESLPGAEPDESDDDTEVKDSVPEV